MKRHRPLAKIDQPRLSGIYERQRIFSLLEEYSCRNIIWLSAPAGYGKTVAVASWLQARGSAAIWYQCDEGDADIASFFYFLSLALANHTGVGDPLPSLSPELYAALPTFVRNYLRAFCSRLTPPTFVVLDNWQDIPAGAPLRELLAVAVEELPRGIVFVVISREEPAANLSRLQCTHKMATIGWTDLKLTEQETAGIAADYKPAAYQRTVMAAHDLHAVTQGWAVGLTVMLRYEIDRPVTPVEVNPIAIQALFNYLTSEVLDRLSDTVKDFLLKTACLEYITVPVASRLTGNSAVRSILDSLVKTNSFTLQRPASATYYYHPLFRELLCSRAAARFSEVERQQLLADAAQILAENHDSEMAINLLLAARRPEEAARMILAVAPTLIQQGRFTTLTVWIEALPESAEFPTGWLTYWRGLAQMAIAFAAAAPTLERAYQLLLKEADELGQMLAIAALLQHIHISFTDFRPMVPWIDVLVKLLHKRPRFPSPSMELSVLTGLFSAILLADHNNARLIECRDRIVELMQSDIDLPSGASASCALMNYFAVSGYMAPWRAFLADPKYPGDSNELGPALRIQSTWMHAYQFHLAGESARCHALLDSALEVAKQHGLPHFAKRLEVSKLQSTDFAPHSAELGQVLFRLEAECAGMPGLMSAHYRYLSAMLRFARGDLSDAVRDIEAADQGIRDTGWLDARILTLVGKGEIMCEVGRLDEASRCLAECEQIMGHLRFPLMDFNMGLLRAEIARRKGIQADFIAALTTALAEGRRQGFANVFHAYPVLLPRLIPYALDLGIEVEYCRWLVRKRNFRPPTRAIQNWPWPIRIHSLGCFRIEVDERAVEIAGKSQRKPLNLLKSILISRNGVEITVLLDRFWADLDGDAARNAFDLAAHRLRKILGHKNAVIVSQGRLMLCTDVVWVDAFAFLTLTESGVTDEAPSGDFPATAATLPWYVPGRRRRRLDAGRACVTEEQVPSVRGAARRRASGLA